MGDLVTQNQRKKRKRKAKRKKEEKRIARKIFIETTR